MTYYGCINYFRHSGFGRNCIYLEFQKALWIRPDRLQISGLNKTARINILTEVIHNGY